MYHVLDKGLKKRSQRISHILTVNLEEMSFLPAQYKRWTWLHYDETEDHEEICRNANDRGMLNNVEVEGWFLKTEYSN